MNRQQQRGIIPKAYIRACLPAGAIIVEAGAHIGLDTIEMGKAWPDVHIHAFEPIPSLYAQLKTNVALLTNVKCYPLAVGSASGIAKMFVSSGASDGSSSLLQPEAHLVDHPDVKFEAQIEVQTITIDEWAKIHAIPRVDFLWLDMQGYELAALAAAPGTLRQVQAIYTEVSTKSTYQNVPLYHELRSWLRERGFRVKREAIPWADGGNVLFVRDA